MSGLPQTLIGIGIAILLAWAALVVVLLVVARDQVSVTGTVRLLPDLLRLVTRLARDDTLPRAVRVRLWALLVYLALPIDLIPDFIPVIGYADDAIVVLLVLRSVIAHAGEDAVTRHWPGTPQGRDALLKLASG